MRLPKVTMSGKILLGLSLLIASGILVGAAQAQGFSCGSTGTDGPIEVTTGTVTLDLPDDGVIHATTVNVAAGATLRFNPNLLNTPVHLLASGDVVIEGIIDVSGSSGVSSPPAGGLGGPGGFAGGIPGIGGLPPGAGQGPGRGLGGGNGCCNDATAGAGAYAVGPALTRAKNGQPYGSVSLLPLAGGSGGGGSAGNPGGAGGGGGGAILICSDSMLDVSGEVRALGGDGISSVDDTPNGGSGGAIRLLSPVVSGAGFLDVQGGCGSGNQCGNRRGGYGWVRVDTISREALLIETRPSGIARVSSTMVPFLDPVPHLDLLEVAGQTIPEGTQEAVSIFLPVGSPTTQAVRVQARDFTGLVPIDVVLTPENGDPIVYPAEIDMAGGSTAVATVQVDFPLNVVTHVHAWTR